jgi:hypothetical protein
MNMICPVPNINGSKASDLAAQMMSVSHALEDAAALMRQWQPHGRDYLTGGDYQADRREFERRQRLVEELAEQYEREAVRVNDYYYNLGRGVTA